MKVEASVKPNRLFAPQLVGLVSSVDKNGRPNVATLAWITTVSADPPLISIAVGRTRYTHGCISGSKEFVLNLPTMNILREVQLAGSLSGRDGDKFEKTGLTPVEAIAVKAPRVEECAAHLECKVVDVKEAGDHTIFIGKVVAAACELEAVKEGVLDISRIKPVLHLGGTFFTTVGEAVNSQNI
ncbi:MAG: flavin reductase family protein [Candidatus Methanoperedens sp.]|nr:flavin reductase family protein [Candidatus Methanoperedens sp.]